MRLFEDFFDDIDDDKLVDDNSKEEISRLSDSGNVNVLSFTHYFAFRYEPDVHNDYKYRNDDEHILNISYFYREVIKTVDDMDFTDDFYVDAPILYSRMKLRTGENEFEPFQFKKPFPTRFNLLKDIPGDKGSNNSYVKKSAALEFNVYFNQRLLNPKTYKQFMRMMIRFCEKIFTIFLHGRQGSVYDLKFYENNRTKEDVEEFKNSGKQIASQSFGLSNTESFDKIYQTLYEDNDLPEDASGYDTSEKKNYWHQNLRDTLEKNFNKIIARGTKLAENRYNVILKPVAMEKNLKINDGWRDKSYISYVVFDMSLKDGSEIESNTIDQCLAECIMNIIPVFSYQSEMKYIIAVRPIGCTIKNSFQTIGRDRENKRKMFVDTPREMRIQNMEYRVDGTKKEYCSQFDKDAEQDSEGRWFKRVWNSTNKLSDKLRSCAYVHYGSGDSAWLVYLDKNGMVMRNAMKCSFYGNGQLQWFIQTKLPEIFGFKYKDEK